MRGGQRSQSLLEVALRPGPDGLELDYAARRCKRCVISEAFPDSAFDGAGLCAYCRAATGPAAAADRNSAFEVLSRSPAERAVDVLVLYSGGKDSTYALLTLIEWGLRVVAFTLDNGFMPPEAYANIARTIAKVGVAHVNVRPEGDLMRHLYRQSLAQPANPEALKYSTAACGACISMVLTTGAREARRLGAPLLAGGWTPGQFTHDALVPGRFLREVCDGHLDPIIRRSKHVADRLDRTNDPDFPPLFNPLYCSVYSEQDVIARLAEVGWRKPPLTDSCSSNCTLNGYLVIDHALKYGYHPYEYELAHHVRTGQMARSAAIEKMRVIHIATATLNAIEASLGVASIDLRN